jgi:short-subunit dehydrogenase
VIDLLSAGFNADVFAALVGKTLLAPSLTLPLLLLARYTSQGAAISESRPKTFRVLKIFVTLGLIRWINQWLGRRARNNWTTDKYVWNKEIAVITGGSDGIGKQIATRLALGGVKVAVLDVQPLKYRAHPNITYFKCDVCSVEDVAVAAMQIREKLGHPTILINNAGILRSKTILASSEQEIRRTFEVNTLAHYWLTQEFLPSMVSHNHGMVVTVASQCASITTPTLVDYSASKAAAMAFHEGLAAELKTRYRAPKVRTVLVTQGFVRTHLTDVLTPEDTWVNPYLYPETVAELIVGQIFSGESGHITAPSTTGAIANNLRSLPIWFQMSLRARLDRLMGK